MRTLIHVVALALCFGSAAHAAKTVRIETVEKKAIFRHPAPMVWGPKKGHLVVTTKAGVSLLREQPQKQRWELVQPFKRSAKRSFFRVGNGTYVNAETHRALSVVGVR